MTNVTIRRCPVCETIKQQTDDLAAKLRDDPNLRVNIVEGNKGEFTIEADGRRIDGKSGDAFRNLSELAAEIQGAGATA